MNFLPLPLKSLWLAVLVFLAAAAAHAEVTVYTSRAAFLAAVGLPGTDTMSLAGLGLVGFAVRRRAG